MRPKFGAAVVSITASILLMPTYTIAQLPPQVGAIVTLSVTDPGGASEPWQVQRRLLRTWTTTSACENEKMKFIGYQIGQVDGYGLIAPSGQSPVIKVESVDCFTIKE